MGKGGEKGRGRDMDESYDLVTATHGQILKMCELCYRKKGSLHLEVSSCMTKPIK